MHSHGRREISFGTANGRSCGLAIRTADSCAIGIDCVAAAAGDALPAPPERPPPPALPVVNALHEGGLRMMFAGAESAD